MLEVAISKYQSSTCSMFPGLCYFYHEDDYGKTALETATEEGHTDVIKLLQTSK